jgi:serine protease AprX
MKRNQCQNAAWGKRFLMLCTLILSVSLGFGQTDRGAAEEGRTFASRSGKMSAALERLADQEELTPGSTGNVRVIVQFKQTPSQRHLDKVEGKGGRLRHRLGLINGGAFSLPAAKLRELANDDEVAYISPDHKLQAADDLTNAAIGLSAARSLNLGTSWMGMGVAVIDSGINDSVYDLQISSTQSYVFYRQDFTGTGYKDSSGKLNYDRYGHGTHVAGILAGDGTNSNGAISGIAIGQRLIDLRVLDKNGVGTDSQVIAAIQKAIALKSTYNIKVINLSLGRPVYVPYATDPLCQAVEQAWKAGITVVVAAGNFGRVSVNGSNGYGTISAPGNDPYVITVGAMKTMNTATRTDDQIASYSSKGPTTYDHVVKPDIVAPGNFAKSIISAGSTLATLNPADWVLGASGNPTYMTLSGTSMATPVVSATAALLLQYDPSLTPDQIKARLMKTAYKTFPSSSVATDPVTHQTYTSFYDLFTVGAGYLDVAAALANTDKAAATVGSALSPHVVSNGQGTVTLVNGNSQVPANSVLWGGSVLWGTSVVWGTNVSGSSVLWGSNSLAGSSVVWGNSSLTGYGVVWGTSNGVVWGATSALNQASSVDAHGEN